MIIFFNKEHNWHLTNFHMIQMSCPFDISPACEKVTAFKESAYICRSVPPEGLSWQSPDVLELGGKR